MDWTLGTSHEQCAYEPAWLIEDQLVSLQIPFHTEEITSGRKTIFMLPNHSTDVLD